MTTKVAAALVLLALLAVVAASAWGWHAVEAIG